MQETEQDRLRLQRCIEASIESAGDFLRKAFQMPDKSLDASELAALFQDMPVLAAATTSRSGAPRVAPTGAIFYRGRFHLPTVQQAARVRMLAHESGISLTYYEGNDLAVIVHGRAELIEPEHADYLALLELHDTYAESTVEDWGDGLFIRVYAERIFSFDRSKSDEPSE